MKKLILFVFLCFSVCVACANPELKEELPPVIKAESKLGALTLDKYGNSVEQINERTELLNLIRNDTVDVVEVSWVMKSNGSTKPMKLVYDKRARTLKKICTKTNEVREFKNVGRLGLCDFFHSGRRSFEKDGLEAYCQKYFSFESAPLAPKPEQDLSTGNVKIVCDYVNGIANDTSNVKYLEWSAVTAVASEGYVRAKFTYINASGVETTRNLGFFIRDGKVFRTIGIK